MLMANNIDDPKAEQEYSVERLFVLAIMRDVGLTNTSEYEAVLNELYLAHLDDPFLLNLELASSDLNATWELITEYILYEQSVLDWTIVELLLLEKLEEVYHSNRFDLSDFAQRAYSVFLHLPDCLKESEELSVLEYADDYLAFGDELATKECYEKMFECARTNLVKN